ncbi:MAG: HAD family phosphatase [Candidatus Obscuribacterales bacterium]|nr:HAD family phosphatase [Cyanobacteria bacterium SZAS LIN-5]
MASYKAILFDYGNVLCLNQLESDVAAMAECLDIELSRFKTYYWQLRDEYDVGAFDGREYWTRIAQKGGREITEQQLRQVIEFDNVGWSRPNLVMARWAETLRTSGMITAIVSNMPADIREYLRDLHWMPEFSHYTYSCEVKSVKPAADIFLHCLEQINMKPAEVLFLDDRQMNVEGARQVGIDSYVFTTAEELAPFVRSIGLPDISLNAMV